MSTYRCRGPERFTCDQQFVTYIDGEPLNQDDVALWNALDWSSCDRLSSAAGAYFFTEQSSNYALLRTFTMTAESCENKPCKSGYRYALRVRTDLDIDEDERTITGETKIYYLRPFALVSDPASLAVPAFEPQ